MIPSPDKDKRFKILDKAIVKIDQVMEMIHSDLGLHDREIEPAENLLHKTRMTLENMKISIERSID